MSKKSLRVVVVVAAVLGAAGAGVAQKPEGQQPPPDRTATKVQLSEATRQAIFADIMACRAEVDKKFEGQTTHTSDAARRSARVALARQDRARAKMLEPAYAQCALDVRQTHQVSQLELDRTMSLGTCKQWAPLKGQPTC